MFTAHEAGPRYFPSRNQLHPFGAIGEPVPDRGRYIQEPPLDFLGTALQWEDPSLRGSITPQRFALQLPPGLPFWVNQRPSTDAAPSRAQIKHWETSNLHSPQPARQFDLSGMWQSPEVFFGPASSSPSFFQPQEPGWGPGPYDFYQPKPPPPTFPSFQSAEFGPANHNQGDWGDVSYQAPLNSAPSNPHFFSAPPPPPSSPGGLLEPNKSVYELLAKRRMTTKLKPMDRLQLLLQ